MIPRVRLLGAESTGKTTLATMLATAYGTIYVPEFGRCYGEMKDRLGERWTSEEFTYIARAQNATEDVAAEYATDILFCDTDVLTTALYHEEYMGRSSPDVLDLIHAYDLTFLLAIDFPFVADGVRVESRRERFERRLVAALEPAPGFVWLRGSLVQRMAYADAVIESRFGLLAQP
jgi:NadR type nicotinamide-nucleotide adenylyltransferase